MKRVPSRLFFPLFHLAMDLILVAVLIFDGRAELRREKRPGTSNYPATTPAATPQESGSIEFDPKYIDRPQSPPLLLLATCAPPAILVFSWLTPKADLQRIVWRSTERWWLAIYALIEALFWFLMGVIADRNQLTVYRWCFALIMIRILALAIVASPIWKLGPILQVLFWLGATISLIAEGLWWLTRRTRSHSRPI